MHSHDHEHHDHKHAHHHHHHEHSISSLESINRAFYIGIGLNGMFTIIEFVVGYLNNSLALIADATHNLSDVFSLLISLIGMKLAQKAATAAYTYGYKKASILASLINAILLMVVVFGIIKEGIERLTNPPEVIGAAIIITALIGVAINGISAFLFMKGQKDDINVRGAFLHLLVDAAVSVGVVISGVIIHFTAIDIIDPIISFVIAIMIFISTWGLLKESVKLTLGGVPSDIKIGVVVDKLLENADIVDVHHVHIWPLSSNENALTAHIVLKKDFKRENLRRLKNKMRHSLKDLKIHHTTFEFGFEGEKCDDMQCTC